MIVAQISDTHILLPEDPHPAASLRGDCLRQSVAAINRQQPDAVILTGDTVQHGKPEEYANTVAYIYETTYVNAETIRCDGAIRMQAK